MIGREADGPLWAVLGRSGAVRGCFWASVKRQDGPKCSQDGPNTPQEAPRDRPRASHHRPRRPQAAQDESQEAPKRHPRGFKRRPKSIQKSIRKSTGNRVGSQDSPSRSGPTFLDVFQGLERGRNGVGTHFHLNPIAPENYQTA